MDIDQDVTVTTNPYKYNGKELERHFGLESYEYGARMMDPQLGMWHTVDPMADAAHNISLSPYSIVADNPIVNIDPIGADWYKDKDGNYSFDPELTQKNAAQFFKDHNIEGASWAFNTGWAFKYATNKDGSRGALLQSYSLNEDGSVTDLINNSKLDGGSSATVEWADEDGSGQFSINAYDNSGSFLDLNNYFKMGAYLGLNISDVYVNKGLLPKLPQWLVGEYSRKIVMAGQKNYTSFLSLELRRIGWQHGGRIIQKVGIPIAVGTNMIDNISYYNTIMKTHPS